MISKIVGVFRAHGAEGMDTPVAELKSVLTAKYGDDGESLIYDLQDQGGELLSLRYDLTVPLARYIASSGRKSLKRYQVGKVYRRDNPAMNSGRYREFYQVDFDIVGLHPLMWADAEVIAASITALRAAGVADFRVAVNHRRNLDSVLEDAGLPKDMLKTVCSSIDKLDKLPWQDVRSELIAKGVVADVADAIGKAVEVYGPLAETVSKVLSDTCRRELQELGELLKAFGVLDVVDLDFSLARGLTYYTGMIFEIKLSSGGGSIGAGGRYDNLLGTIGRNDLPAVGCSLGIDRLLSVVDKPPAESTAPRIFVATADRDLTMQKMRLLATLWEGGIDARHQMKLDPALPPLFKPALKQGCTHIAIIGDKDIDEGMIVVKNLESHTCQVVPIDGIITLVLAPELLGKGIMSHASDVYSFAILAWHLVCCEAEEVHDGIAQLIVKVVLHD